ncbi:hypothetical protein ALO56_200107 [Pseudomonas viridiflava]|nr:hypothetical protein ALO56_200107 [Pseudomonas viridiflava]
MRPRQRTGPAVGNLPFADPAIQIADRHLQGLGARTAIRSGNLYPVLCVCVEADPGKIGAHVGREVSRRVMHFIDQLLSAGRGVDPSARAFNLGDRRLPCCIDFCQRKTQPGQVRHVLETRIGEVPPADLPRTFEQVTHQRAASQQGPVIGSPAEFEHLRREKQRRIGHPAGNHHVGIGFERLHDAFGAQISVGRDQPVSQ